MPLRLLNVIASNLDKGQKVDDTGGFEKLNKTYK